MTTQTLDLASISANYAQSVDLDGATFTLTFHYLKRGDCWLVDIDDAQGNPVVHGRKLTAGEVLLNGVALLNRPAGDLVVVDTSNADQDPRLNDLSGDAPRVVTCYVPAGS